VKKPSGEQQRRIPLQEGQNNRCHVTRRNITELHKLINSTLLSPHLNPSISHFFSLSSPAFISCTAPCPLVTELAGDEREEFSILFFFCREALNAH